MERLEVGIVIPALNEAATIARVVTQVVPYGQVIVVDDASTDGTSELAQAAGAQVVRHKTNEGYDRALNSGFEKALNLKCKYVLTFDADGQHDSELLRAYLKELGSGIDLVLGKRPQKARFAEKIMGIYFYLRFGLNDILCGMKGYRMELYTQYGSFDTIGSVGTELALVSIKRGARFVEISVPIHPRQDQPRFGNILKSNWRLFRALIRIIALDFRTSTTHR